MLCLLISFITLIAINTCIPLFPPPSINCSSCLNHQGMLVPYHFCDDAMACLTYDSNNFDPTFCNNWVASILQLLRVITGHTADNTTCCKTSPIQPGYHSMPGHVTHYRSSIQGCFMPDTSVHRFMPGHVTCYTSDTFVQWSVQCCFMPCYFMPGHATCYPSDTSVQRRFMPVLELWYNTLDILCTNGHFSSISPISRDRIEIT